MILNLIKLIKFQDIINELLNLADYQKWCRNLIIYNQNLLKTGKLSTRKRFR